MAVHRCSGIVTGSAFVRKACEDPGSAAHHFVLRCAREALLFSKRDRKKKNPSSVRSWGSFDYWPDTGATDAPDQCLLEYRKPPAESN